MSELIQKVDNRASLRWKLLAGVSATALAAYVASADFARAEDATAHPTVWIELGGQLDIISGISNSPSFSAPFLYQDPVPEVYQGISVKGIQKLPRFAFGEEGKVTFQPEDSDWKFTAGIRYGRSRSNRHIHNQTQGPIGNFYTRSLNVISYSAHLSTAAFFDAALPSRESHLLLDFSVGKDVGVGLLGPDATSTVNVGVRALETSTSQSGTIYARPNVTVHYPGPKYTLPRETFNAYTMTARAERSFHGVGPSVTWEASTALAGNNEKGELALDWSVNAALLFGRQKAKTSHSTQAHEEYISYTRYYGYVVGMHYGYRNLYGPNNHDNPLRSHRVTVPNIGGSIGLSVKYPNFKFSMGYRYDTFFNAMDTGVDELKKSNLTFQGPYASISIGLGG